MDILISWSGRQSRMSADALYMWLPKVVPTAKPWLSSLDIDKGSRWRSELHVYLTKAKGCIVCVTPDNIDSQWIYWETGAISLVQEHPICPFLVNVTPAQLSGNPLDQFQCTFATESDVLLLVHTLNKRLTEPDDELRLRGLFHQHWSELRTKLSCIADSIMPENVREMLKELSAIQERYHKRWYTDKKAESLDAIRTLLVETTNKVEQLYSTGHCEQRTKHHLLELKGKVAEILAPSTREKIHERGDVIFKSFDKAVAAIRADYEPPES